MNNTNELDANYFKGKLALVMDGINNYTSPELARELSRLAKTADDIAAAEVIHAPAQPQSQHTDDDAVDRFAVAMKAKLKKKRGEYRDGWETCEHDHLVTLLIGHIKKGDPVDVGNFAMMIHQRGEVIDPPAQPDAEAASYERMFMSAATDLGLINESPDLDPDDGGAEVILDAIDALKARIAELGTEVRRLDAGWARANLSAHTAQMECHELKAQIAAQPIPDLINIGSMRYQGKSVAGWVIEAKAAQAGQEPDAYYVLWGDIGEWVSESLYYGDSAKAHMQDAVDYAKTIPRPALVTPLYAAPLAPANALAIVSAALEAAAKNTMQIARDWDASGHMAGHAAGVYCADAIRAILPQSVIDSMEGK